MSTDSRYQRKDNLRACSICGVRWHASDMRYIGQNRWACPDDAEGLTAEQISRHNARVRPLLVRQFKNPLITGEVPDYRIQEGVLFNLVCKFATTASVLSNINGGISSAQTPQSAAQCALYLSDIIRENLRPASWITQAKTTLSAIAVYLRSVQSGPVGSGGGVVAITSTSWGGFGLFTALGHGYCALALIRAYSILGTNDFLVGATAACDYIRQSLQRGDAPVVDFTSPIGVPVGRYLGGGFRESIGNFSSSRECWLSGAFCMWPLKELGDILGTSFVLGSPSAGGGFNLVPSGTIAFTLSEARKFYVTGVLAGFSVPPSTGVFLPALAPLSTTTPRQRYIAALSGGGAAGGEQWHLASVPPERFFLASDVASALRALFECEGYSVTVASVYEWLMTFASNPAGEVPAGTSVEATRNGALGALDVDLALPFQLELFDANQAPVIRNFIGAAAYDLPWTAILSPVRVASGRTTRRFKETFAKPILAQTKVPGPGRTVSRADARGACGLSFQALDDRVIIGSAAQFGLSYRYAPVMTQIVKAG